jgi:ferredoxin/flavodoxin
MRRIALLYFSGVGGTRIVAELLGEILSARYEASATSLYSPSALARARESDLMVLCFPTYFLRPAPSMMEFVGKLGPFDPPRPVYVVATYELYTENAIRALAIKLRERGLLVVGAKALRAPGTDVTCLVPARLCPWLYRFENGLPRKMMAIAEELSACADARPDALAKKARIPTIKWYTPFAQALQVLALNRFDGWRWKFRALPDRCTLCGACVKACHRRAWEIAGGAATHIPERCELCTRCVHRCPERAIVLAEGLKDNKRLDSRLYASLKDDARRKLFGVAREDSAGGQNR